MRCALVLDHMFAQALVQCSKSLSSCLFAPMDDEVVVDLQGAV